MIPYSIPQFSDFHTLSQTKHKAYIPPPPGMEIAKELDRLHLSFFGNTISVAMTEKLHATFFLISYCQDRKKILKKTSSKDTFQVS